MTMLISTAGALALRRDAFMGGLLSLAKLIADSISKLAEFPE
jgi:hypothetical protein